MLVDLAQDGTIPLHDGERILLKQVSDLDIELLVASDRISRVEGRSDKLTLVDVERLELVAGLLPDELVSSYFLEALPVVV